jgi:hypothetical protein
MDHARSDPPRLAGLDGFFRLSLHEHGEVPFDQVGGVKSWMWSPEFTCGGTSTSMITVS